MTTQDSNEVNMKEMAEYTFDRFLWKKPLTKINNIQFSKRITAVLKKYAAVELISTVLSTGGTMRVLACSISRRPLM